MEQKFQPDAHEPNAGRLKFPNEDVCVVNMLAEHLRILYPPNVVTWATWRDPNPAEKKTIELVVATGAGVKLSPAEAIAKTRKHCHDVVQQVSESFETSLRSLNA